MARGGRRSGVQGRSYPNRSDMRAPKIAAAPNQAYGVAGQQLEAQRAQPVGPPPHPTGAGRAAPPARRTGPPPGAAGPFDRPSERPGEPVTAGLPVGPGPGPEVLPQPQMPERVGETKADLARWKVWLPALELLASRPEVSQEARDFVRRLRAGMDAL